MQRKSSKSFTNPSQKRQIIKFSASSWLNIPECNAVIWVRGMTNFFLTGEPLIPPYSLSTDTQTSHCAENSGSVYVCDRKALWEI